MQVKPVDGGKDDFETCAGYAMKDRRMPGFAWRAIGMTQDYLDYYIQVYERHTHGYAAGKTMLSKANWPAKTFGFWSRNFLPLDVPYAAVLKHMIAQDQFCISSSFITNGNGIMAHRARAFWGIVMDTQRCTSEGIMRTMTDYYDQYEREKLRAAMWEESSSDDEDCPDEDFRNPFARGDAFVPMKAAAGPKKRKRKLPDRCQYNCVSCLSATLSPAGECWIPGC